LAEIGFPESGSFTKSLDKYSFCTCNLPSHRGCPKRTFQRGLGQSHPASLLARPRISETFRQQLVEATMIYALSAKNRQMAGNIKTMQQGDYGKEINKKQELILKGEEYEKRETKRDERITTHRTSTSLATEADPERPGPNCL
jgi:hypothetical protein